jgi:hypothetical protein
LAQKGCEDARAVQMALPEDALDITFVGSTPDDTGMFLTNHEKPYALVMWVGLAHIPGYRNVFHILWKTRRKIWFQNNQIRNRPPLIASANNITATISHFL